VLGSPLRFRLPAPPVEVQTRWAGGQPTRPLRWDYCWKPPFTETIDTYGVRCMKQRNRIVILESFLCLNAHDRSYYAVSVSSQEDGTVSTIPRANITPRAAIFPHHTQTIFSLPRHVRLRLEAKKRSKNPPIALPPSASKKK
jgi:hypothetical protein